MFWIAIFVLAGAGYGVGACLRIFVHKNRRASRLMTFGWAVLLYVPFILLAIFMLTLSGNQPIGTAGRLGSVAAFGVVGLIMALRTKSAYDTPSSTQEAPPVDMRQVNDPSSARGGDTTSPMASVRSPLRKESDEELWAKALHEFEGEDRRPGLWAQVYAESKGDEAVAKANYITRRFQELKSV